jgi:antitoxin ParD1/3/4
MPTRNVVLTEHQADLVERLVSTGRYQNASEVLREGLRLVEDREAEEKARIEALRKAAQIGMADIAAGRYRSFETPETLDRHLTALAQQVIKQKPSRKRSA